MNPTWNSRFLFSFKIPRIKFQTQYKYLMSFVEAQLLITKSRLEKVQDAMIEIQKFAILSTKYLTMFRIM